MQRWLVLPRYSRTRLRLASIAWYKNNYFAASNSKFEILDMHAWRCASCLKRMWFHSRTCKIRLPAVPNVA